MRAKLDSLLTSLNNRAIIKEMRLKENLRLMLDRVGMTATQLARKSGVSKQVISLWLSGAEPRKLDQVKQVANVLDVSVDALCFADLSRSKDDWSTLNSDEDMESFIRDGWIGGVFEVRLRRIRGSTDRKKNK
ncbi:MAG TPA: helix-turn-helix transcriptional regulator [Bdellovibrionota bacterium]|nr:helix-turn-helix transcriptional regulator [Bdellovibrionota bacterium]